MIRALTLKQPWATAVLAFGKTIENRNWPPYAALEFPFPMWIHAGAAWDDNWHDPLIGLAAAGDLPVGPGIILLGASTMPQVQCDAGFPRRAILGQVTVVGAHRAGDDCGDACDIWGRPGDDVWHWELAGPRRCPLVPAVGLQKLWTPKGELAEQLAGVTFV